MEGLDEKYIYMIIGAIVLINIVLMFIMSKNKKKAQSVQKSSKQSAATKNEYEQIPVSEHAKTEVLGSGSFKRNTPPAQPVQNVDKTEFMGSISNLSDEEKNQIKSNSKTPVNETIVFGEEEKEEIKEVGPAPFAFLLYKDNDEQVQIPLVKDATLIGRDPEVCDVTITSDNYLGRSHAMLYKKGEKLFLADLSSKNGTFINGEQIKGQVEINYNSKFKVGRTGIELQKIGG